ncbi:MAG: hypothetical protein V4638_02450 [Bacteroidota bacterium]
MENEKSILNQLEPKKVTLPSDDFFVDLSKSTIEKAILQKSKNHLQIIYYSVSAIAAIFIIAFLLIVSSNETVVQSNDVSFVKVDSEEIQEYLAPEMNEITTVQGATQESTSSAAVRNNEDLFASISTGDLAQYIEEEDVDSSEDEVDDLFY